MHLLNKIWSFVVYYQYGILFFLPLHNPHAFWHLSAMLLCRHVYCSFNHLQEEVGNVSLHLAVASAKKCYKKNEFRNYFVFKPLEIIISSEM